MKGLVQRKRPPTVVGTIMVKTSGGRLMVGRPRKELVEKWNNISPEKRRKEVREFFHRFVNGDYSLSEPAYQKICCAFGIRGD